MGVYLNPGNPWFRRWLQETVSRLISGEEIEVDTESFENGFETFGCRDDVLTLLIHLGYLIWHEEEGTARIPNEEVRAEFRKILRGRNMNRKWVKMCPVGRRGECLRGIQIMCIAVTES